MRKVVGIFKNKTFLLLAVLVVLTIFLVVTTILRPEVFQQTFKKLQSFASDISTGKLWREKSQARVFIEDESLKVAFTISPDDQPNLKLFNQKLAIGEAYLDGIALKLDTQSIKKLEPFLPLELIIQIEPERIEFQNGIVPGFASSLVTETTELSTGSARLKMVRYSQTEYSLEIADPEPLLQQATASGQFVLSDKLLQLYPILERVSTIEMNINGKSVSGEVKLK